ncbi:MAG: hypothetical protein C0418_05955 [Coriobacteriaceae bacterium]|nr:hypothetical protein [Coriobacteriaceae bacterium]
MRRAGRGGPPEQHRRPRGVPARQRDRRRLRGQRGRLRRGILRSRPARRGQGGEGHGVNGAPRLAALRGRLAEEKVDAFLVTDPVNVAYVTGFDGVFDSEPASACLVTPGAATVYTDFRYAEALKAQASSSGWSVVVVAGPLNVRVCEDVAAAGLGVLGVESSVPYGRFKYLSEHLEGRVLAADEWVERVRSVKTADELERIAAAAELADEAMAHGIALVAPGRTEREVAIEIEVHLLRAGSEGVPFPPIVAAGPNAARPHARPSDRRMGRGEPVIIDLGARVGGYCSDLTRTVVAGTADGRVRELYAATLAAQEAGLAAVRAGVAAKDADAVAREVLGARGLAEAFGHGLGHGVGLEVHELPSMGARSREVLAAGMVVTVEPGVYLPAWGGVRIEDLVAVEEGGCRLLSRAPKELAET